MCCQKLLVFITFCCLVFEGYGQQVTVRKRWDFAPIADVFVYDSKHKNSTFSDSLGTVSLAEFSDGDTLIFQHPSFKKNITTKEEILMFGRTVLLRKNIISIGEFVFAVFHSGEQKRESIQQITSIDAKTIETLNPQTTADMLQGSGSVLVQKSQMGGGSPVIRGMEANRVLLVIDGVRLNNAIYRSGHLQNAITIDNSILERAEVIFGPSSVIYGSDALGGVMHFYTKKPQLAKNDTNNYRVNTYFRYSTANEETTGHADVNLGYKKFGFLTSITTSKFGDLKMGTRRYPDYPDFGKVYHYAENFDGKDSMLVNENPDVQKFTGYSQIDFLEKILYSPNEKLDFTFNFQYSTSSDIPRFDRLNDYKGNTLKFAEWSYGPQKRLLSSLNTHFKSESKLLSEGQITIAFQNIEESRITRRFNDPIRYNRTENVNVYSLNAHFTKNINDTEKLQYGLESTYNDVQSSAFSQNITTEEVGFASTRYPDGGSVMQSHAVYLNYKRKLSDKLIANAGGRYSYVLLHSKFEDTSLYQLPFREIDINNGALTGSLGLLFLSHENLRFRLVGSSGFRNPNVDDYGKIFEKNGNIVIPNEQLKPEFAYNAEAGMDFSLLDKAINFSGTIFYTYLKDAIVRRDFSLNGQDSLLYDGELAKAQANINSNQAVIYGYSLGVKAYFVDDFSTESTWNHLYGKDLTDGVPLGHIPPVFGKSSINYQTDDFFVSFYAYYNGKKPIEEYSPSGVDNEEEATSDGTLAWYTLNASVMYSITDKVKIQLALENISDKHYKPFASGLSGAGRNLVIKLKVAL
ncbi:TonB-dependent receptor [Bacteroidales bacterium AH-315-I05]|nr:TonB-dependent receptor [Bacteroidales bacterium AH-315-I05]